MNTLKYFLILLVSFSVLHTSKAQYLQFNHDYGSTFMLFYGNNTAAGSPALTYRPSLIVKKLSEEVSLSTNVDLSLAFVLSFGSFDSFLDNLNYEIPVYLNMNFGYGSSYESQSGFGGFIGAGYGYNSRSIDYYDNALGQYVATGPTTGLFANAGIKWENKNNYRTNILTFYTILSRSVMNVYGGRYTTQINW